MEEGGRAKRVRDGPPGRVTCCATLSPDSLIGKDEEEIMLMSWKLTAPPMSRKPRAVEPVRDLSFLRPACDFPYLAVPQDGLVQHRAVPPQLVCRVCAFAIVGDGRRSLNVPLHRRD